MPLSSATPLEQVPDESPLAVTAPLAERVVKAPEDAVPPPIAPGAAKVAPLSEEAFKFATLVVDATTNGAEPVERVEVIAPLNAPVVVLTGASILPEPSVCRITELPVVAVALLDVTVDAVAAIGTWVAVIPERPPVGAAPPSIRLPLVSQVAISPFVLVALVEETTLVAPDVPVSGKLDVTDVAPPATGI